MPKNKSSTTKKTTKPKQKTSTKTVSTSLSDFLGFLIHHPLQLTTWLLIASFFLLLPGQNYFQTLLLTYANQPTNILEPAIYQRAIPVRPPEVPPPQITATSAIVIDLDSAAVLYQKQPDTRQLPASTTKIMTALVALNEYQMSDIVTITNENQSVGNVAELYPGEQLTVKDLLHALMISSGNDAAVALAQHHPDGYFGFIKRMNQLAKDLQLRNTHFTNASGIEDPQHFSSARDLAILTKHILTYPLIIELTSTPTTTITSIDGKYSHYLQNTNQLLTFVPGMYGVKTGWTLNAGECFVGYVNRDNRRIITVVLGSNDRFGETAQLIDWVYQNHIWLEAEELLEIVGS